MARGHKHKQVFTQCARYFYTILTNNGMYQQILEKATKYETKKIRPVGVAVFHADGQIGQYK